MQPISSARLSLQTIEEKDVPALFSLVQNHPEITEYLSWNVPASLEEMMTRHKVMEKENTAGTRQRFGIFYENKIIGSVSLTNIVYKSGRRTMNTGELGYWLSPEHAGKGFATEAAQAILQYGFETLNLQKIKATCVPENIASQKILEKIHMRYVGTSENHFFEKNKWWDMKLYEITVDAWRESNSVK